MLIYFNERTYSNKKNICNGILRTYSKERIRPYSRKSVESERQQAQSRKSLSEEKQE